MKAFWFCLFAALLAAPAAPSAPLERDLGMGLAYVRVHVLPGDLPGSAAVGPRPCVLDVRYVSGGDAEAGALLGWLKHHASIHTPVFLLANRDTSPALLAPLNSADAVTGLVIVGASAAGFTPDLALPVSSADERRAYDAMEQGASVESLITDHVLKSRNDEATLAKARLSDTGADDSEAPATPAAATDAAAAAASPPRVIDPVLQRAVQLHRSLLALKRL
jgi:hypothetical protein